MYGTRSISPSAGENSARNCDFSDLKSLKTLITLPSTSSKSIYVLHDTTHNQDSKYNGDSERGLFREKKIRYHAGLS